MNSQRAIGIFDSGIGGLSIMQRLAQLQPNENLLYVADSAYAPYGDKPTAYIIERCEVITRFLLEHDVKAIVVACNTATVSAIKHLRQCYEQPFIGVEPGIKPAAYQTRSGIIGVLATTQTINSESFRQLQLNFTTDVRIEIQACPGLVECIEALALQDKKTEKLVRQYVKPLVDKGVDHIVLGCTHYAFLESMIQRIAGPSVTVINTDQAVARETMRRLQTQQLLSNSNQPGDKHFYSSGEIQAFKRQIHQLWSATDHVYTI